MGLTELCPKISPPHQPVLSPPPFTLWPPDSSRPRSSPALATPEAPAIFDVSGCPHFTAPITPGKHQRGGRRPGVSPSPQQRACVGEPPICLPFPFLDSLYFCPQLLSPPETSRDPRVSPVPFPQVSIGNGGRGVPSRRASVPHPRPLPAVRASPPSLGCLEKPPSRPGAGRENKKEQNKTHPPTWP